MDNHQCMADMDNLQWAAMDNHQWLADTALQE
jgi:hypothetical protein